MPRCALPARRPEPPTQAMSEPEKPSGDRPVHVPPARAAARGANPLVWLLVLALLAAAGYGLWRGWLWSTSTLEAMAGQDELIARLGREVQSLRAQADELATRQTDLSQAVQRNGVDLANLDGRL